MHGTIRDPTLTGRATRAARDVLEGRRRGWRALPPFIGPAVIVSVAYIDPGNFAANIEAGASQGYALLWVVLAANLVAMLFQSLSAKLGIVTGRNLAELCREHFPRGIVIAIWIVSEIAAMATDLAEFLGGAIGLALLAGIPLWAGMVVTAAATYAILLMERRGFRPLEIVIGAMVGVIGASYLIETALATPDWAAVARHSFVPSLPNVDAVRLAVGIIGATVMPHALFLHSALTQSRLKPRDESERRRLIRWSNRELIVALGLAGLINMAMVAMAATVFHAGHSDVAAIETAYRTLVPLLGAGAGAVFLVALLTSGLSSSVVGTMAGQIIMQGYVGFRIPLWLRRAVTMVPAIVVVALGAATTDALVASQIVLCLVLPIPMGALLLFTRRGDVMGAHANRPATTILAGAAVIAVTALDLAYLASLIAYTWA